MKKMKIGLHALIIACLVFAAGSATAATHIVPGAYSTIQEAIDSAQNGDTISIRPGIYYENLVLRTKSLTLSSLNGAAQTIIDGGHNGPVVYIASGSTIVLDGFTIQNGQASSSGESAGGIYVYYETPGTSNTININNCIIANNTGNHGGGGINSFSVPNPPSWNWIRLSNSSVVNNTSRYAAGIRVLGYGSFIIDNCTIANNRASEQGGGVYGDYLSNVDINNTYISGNSAGQAGGGVQVASIYSFMTIENSVIDLNSASLGGGIYATGSPSYVLTLNNNTISRNTATEGGGIAQEPGRRINGSNNIIYGNSTPPVFREIGSVTIQYSVVEGGIPGTGNSDVDPLFVNPLARNYQLRVASPAIDAGTGGTGNDIFGIIRPQGMGYDLGAYEYVPPDTIAPVSSATYSGTVGANGWYTSVVTVTLAATDAGGVREIHYKVNGMETVVPGSSAMVQLSTDGSNAFSFYAVDNAGNTEAEQFATINIDRSAPTVSSTNPANNATGVPRSSSIVVTFSEAVSPGSAYANIVLRRGSTTITTTKTLSGNTLTITPSSRLSSNTNYTVTIPANSVVDVAGNNIAATYTFTFRTGSN